MCGLVGMIGTLEMKHQDLMPDLLMVCQVRGRDSTGVIKVAANDTSDWLKQVGTPDFLTNSPVYRQRIGQGVGKALIGHCRHKTVGDANRDNAHPFQHEHITGVHNGTLRQWKQFEKANQFDVDSDWLFYNLSQHGEEETFSKLSHDSAYCCIWHNDENNTINFLRNNKRPLWFTWSDDKKVMFWASEIWMLGIVARANNITIWEGDKDGNKYFPLPVDTLWSFEVDRTFVKNKPSLTLRKAKIIKQKEAPTTNFTNTRGNAGASAGNPNHWKNRGNGVFSRNNGGSVSSPFLPNDPVDDIGQQQKGTSSAAEGSTPTKTSATSSDSKKSNVLDFRMGAKPTINSVREKLSLRSESSKTTQQEDKEKSSKSCGEKPKTSRRKPKGLVSFRNVVGTSYLTDNKTGREITLEEFENNTKGVCCFCKNAIGDEKEVSEFISPTKFICTTCKTEPEQSLSA